MVDNDLKFNPSYIGLRKDLLKFIDEPCINVLDLGCANGVNGTYLLDKGLAQYVFGIELDPDMAREASKKYSKVLCGNLDDKNFVENIVKILPDFDCIIFGDILEHLVDPDKILKIFQSKLSESGKVIISLPNIAHIELFIQVYIKGTWPKNNRGIFDKTHLRWFCLKDAIKMIENSNLTIKAIEPKFRSRDPIGSKFNIFYQLIKYFNPNWVTFQYIFICEKIK